MGENADANMFHSKKLPFLCVRIAFIMADLPRGFNDDFSSFARGGSDGVKNTKKQHGLLTSDGQKTVLLCCLVRAWGLEPQRLAAREPKSRMSANFIMPAYILLYHISFTAARRKFIAMRACAIYNEAARDL